MGRAVPRDDIEDGVRAHARGQHHAGQGACHLQHDRPARPQHEVQTGPHEAADHGEDRQQDAEGQHLQHVPVHDALGIEAAEGQERGLAVGVDHARGKEEGDVALPPQDLDRGDEFLRPLHQGIPQADPRARGVRSQQEDRHRPQGQQHGDDRPDDPFRLVRGDIQPEQGGGGNERPGHLSRQHEGPEHGHQNGGGDGVQQGIGEAGGHRGLLRRGHGAQQGIVQQVRIDEQGTDRAQHQAGDQHRQAAGARMHEPQGRDHRDHHADAEGEAGLARSHAVHRRPQQGRGQAEDQSLDGADIGDDLLTADRIADDGGGEIGGEDIDAHHHHIGVPHPLEQGPGPGRPGQAEDAAQIRRARCNDLGAGVQSLAQGIGQGAASRGRGIGIDRHVTSRRAHSAARPVGSQPVLRARACQQNSRGPVSGKGFSGPGSSPGRPPPTGRPGSRCPPGRRCRSPRSCAGCGA